MTIRGTSKAVLWMTGALFCFLTMAIAGRALSPSIPLHEIVFLRNVACMLVLLWFLAHFGLASIRTARPLRHVVRNSVHYCAQYLWFLAVLALPLAEVFAIEFTVPIWTALLAAVFLSERLTRSRLSAIGLGFVGVIVILRPGLEILHPASFAVLAAALGFATVFVITKGLVAYDRPFVILFWMNFVQLPIGVVPCLFEWVTPGLADLPWILATGIAGLGSHYCLSRAMQVADVTVVAPMDFLRLPLGAVVGWAWYAEALDTFVFAGAALICMGNWINLKAEARAAR